jgi:septal ring factor EnvC (AmiA/AmiB activator)
MDKVNNTHAKTKSCARGLLTATITCLLLPAASAFGQMQQQSQVKAQAQAQNQNQVQQKLQALQAELQALNAEIREVQNEANQTPAVREALKNYSATLTEQMKAINPDKADAIDRRQEIYDELLTANDGSELSQQEQAELRQLAQKFNAVRQDLQTVEAQANQSAEVREAMTEYNDNLMEEMANEDPSIMEKIERQQAASQEFSNLRSAIMQN